MNKYYMDGRIYFIDDYQLYGYMSIVRPAHQHYTRDKDIIWFHPEGARHITVDSHDAFSSHSMESINILKEVDISGCSLESWEIIKRIGA